MRSKPNPPVRYGAANNRYNGGICVRRDGRCVIVCRDGTLMLYYRGVMAAQVGRLLRSDEIVHHVNGNCSDDRVENLEITSRAAHLAHHRAEVQAGRAPLVTHCKRGHAYDEANTYVWHGTRHCRACAAERARRGR